MGLSIPVKLILSLLLGAVVGLERESYEKKVDKTHLNGTGSLGIRSFSLIAFLGTLAGILAKPNFSLFLLISCTFMLLLICYYIIGSFFTKDNGITTELAIMIAFLIGIFIGMEIFSTQLVIAITVILVLILSLKEQIQLFVAEIKQNELQSFISYAIIALVILPFAPNISYSLSNFPWLIDILAAFNINVKQIVGVEIFNPFSLWRIVVIITGIEVIGYILKKTIGQKKGLVFASLAGGFISSTSTTQSLANQSKNSENINSLVSAAVFANLSSFFQNFILIATVSSIFLVKASFFLLAISVTAATIGFTLLMLQKNNKQENSEKTQKQLKEDKIFSLKPALQFALIFLTVKLFSNLSLILFGEGAFLITAVLASLTGMDAITINLAQLAGTTITFQTALFALVLANSVNLVSKAIYSFIQGKKEFALKFSLSVLLITLSGFVSLLFSY